MVGKKVSKASNKVFFFFKLFKTNTPNVKNKPQKCFQILRTTLRTPLSLLRIYCEKSLFTGMGHNPKGKYDSNGLKA